MGTERQSTESLEERVNRLTNGRVIEAVADYCLTAGPPWCYRKWPRKMLIEYLSFHALNGTMTWMAELGAKSEGRNPKAEFMVVTGCAVAWQTNEGWIREAEAQGLHVFKWEPTEPEGDSLFMADFIGSRPGAVRLMLNQFQVRWPAWRGLKYFTYRKERLVRLNGTHYERRFEPGEGRGSVRA